MALLAMLLLPTSALYIDPGLVARVPLSYSAWAVSGGIHLLSLGDALTSFNDDGFQPVGTFGFNIGY